jgi:eukaryotic-like serine/threonine-protein kinase
MSPADAEFRPGHVIAARYELLSKLGEGGMGVVFRATDRMLGEEVALKLLRSIAASDPQYAQRLRSEIRLARRIGHRNVCRIYEYNEDGAHQYIAMELIHGETLRSLVTERSALPADEATSIAAQIASGLEAIHEQRVVHRDLKPANVMLDSAGVAKVMDFGIAKRWDAATTQLTETGTIIGTPEYMSPEQAQGLAMDGRSDLYSLGLMLYEMITGRVAFRGTTPVATLLLHVQAPPPLDGPEAARVPAPLLAVLRRVLAKKPTERYANAAEMRAALHAALGGATAAAAAQTGPASRTVLLEATAPLPHPPAGAVATSPQRKTPTDVPAPTRSPKADGHRRIWPVALSGLAMLMGILVLAVAGWVLFRGTQAPRVDTPPHATLPEPAHVPAAAAESARGQIPTNDATVDRRTSGSPNTAPSGSTQAAPHLSAPADSGRTASLSSRAPGPDSSGDDARRLQAAKRSEAGAQNKPLASLVLDETVLTPSSTAPAPPGMGRLPPGVIARPADPGARIEAKLEPSRLGPGNAYVVRFHLVNLRETPLRLAAASLRRGTQPPTMLRLEATVAPPLTRTLVGETKWVWTADAAGQEAMTFSILLEDGGLYSCTLRAHP